MHSVVFGFQVGHGSLGSHLVLSLCVGCAFAQFMTQEAAQKCLEAAFPEAEVRKTFPLVCNLGDSSSQGQQLIFPQNFIIIIVNDIKIIKLRLIEHITCVRTSLVSQMVKNLPTM